VYPNPFENSFTVELYTEAQEEVSVDLYTLSGHNVYSKKQKLLKGKNYLKIDEHNFSIDANVYMVVIVGQSMSYSQKVIKGF